MASVTVHLPSLGCLRLASVYGPVHSLVQKELNCSHHRSHIKPNYSIDDSMLMGGRKQKISGAYRIERNPTETSGPDVVSVRGRGYSSVGGIRILFSCHRNGVVLCVTTTSKGTCLLLDLFGFWKKHTLKLRILHIIFMHDIKSYILIEIQNKKK